ncbi:MAG: hypothetical protein FWF63_03245 [Fibromonadales bacterium]|nr:hypothetical protein [Fibromonadales bacterium]
MNVSEITTRVADLIRNPDSPMPSERDRSIQKKQTQAPAQPEPSKPDTNTPATTERNPAKTSEYNLALSPLAQKILEDADSHKSDWEKKRSENVQRIQQLVHEKQYHLAPEVVDGIARKIVNMLH